MIQFRDHRAGLTLVEMLVAVTLTLMIMSLFSTLMYTATSGVSTMRGITTADQKVRAAVATIRRDVENVYISRSGSKLSPAELFTGPSKIPDSGYLMIEENDGTLYQGLDAWGVPVTVDTDDVLGLTVGLSGTSAQDIFYGKVTHQDTTLGNALVTTTTGVQQIGDVGEYLDNTHGSPLSRYDEPNNGVYTSRFAEVVYFLRPADRQPTVNDLRSDLTAPATVPPIPVTYNLYRRQLLVVDNASQLNRSSALATNGVAMATVHDTTATPRRAFYNEFDLSASREFEQTTTTTNWVFPVPGGVGRIHFNSLSDLAKREYRYGMRLHSFYEMNSLENPPRGYTTPAASTTAPRYSIRTAPMSHVYPANPVFTQISGAATGDLLGDPGSGTRFLHEYYNHTGLTGSTQWNAVYEAWIGRPTLEESAFPGTSTAAAYPFWEDIAPNNTSPGNYVNLSVANAGQQTGKLQSYPNVGQRSGEDLLLTNVISFDIKVLEDRRSGQIYNSTGTSTAVSNMSIASNPLRGHALNVAPYNAPSLMSVQPDEYRPEFVDLGFLADRASPLTRPGADANCLLSNNYYFVPNAGTPPPTTDRTLTFDTGIAPFGIDLVGYMYYGANKIPGATGDDNSNSDTDETYQNHIYNELGYGDDVPSATPPPASPLMGTDGQWGRALIDDDGDGTVDNVKERFWPGSDDLYPPFYAPFGSSGQIAGFAAPDTSTAGGQNPGNLNPRNTYDSWCFAQPGGSVGNEYNPDKNKESSDLFTFRPVPYPRPLKAIQIKLRVLEPSSGVVRDFTIVHSFQN